MPWYIKAEYITSIGGNLEAIGYKDPITEMFGLKPKNRIIARGRIRGLDHDGQNFNIIIDNYPSF